MIRLVHRIADVPQLAQEATRVLRRAVPFDGTCLLTMDPATLLPTGDVVENALPPSAAVRLTEIELREPDVNKFTYLARGPLPAAGLAWPYRPRSMGAFSRFLGDPARSRNRAQGTSGGPTMSMPCAAAISVSRDGSGMSSPSPAAATTNCSNVGP